MINDNSSTDGLYMNDRFDSLANTATKKEDSSIITEGGRGRPNNNNNYLERTGEFIATD